MQRGFLKIVGPLILLIAPFFATAQASSHRLKTADSLFSLKLYTQSLEHYNEILRQKSYTPAMLLKMAFIHEGLNQIGQALYYLNLYYMSTKDELAQEKIQDLAKKYNLEGYEVTENDKLLAFYHEYHQYISLSLGAILIFLISIAFYSQRKLKLRPVASFVATIIIALAFFVHLYFGEQISTAIISDPSTYVMTGPSAGASVVEIIGDGHRVEVTGRTDVWLRVRWDGNAAYVKESCVLPLSL